MTIKTETKDGLTIVTEKRLYPPDRVPIFFKGSGMTSGHPLAPENIDKFVEAVREAMRRSKRDSDAYRAQKARFEAGESQPEPGEES